MHSQSQDSKSCYFLNLHFILLSSAELSSQKNHKELSWLQHHNNANQALSAHSLSSPSLFLSCTLAPGIKIIGNNCWFIWLLSCLGVALSPFMLVSTERSTTVNCNQEPSLNLCQNPTRLQIPGWNTSRKYKLHMILCTLLPKPGRLFAFFG